MSETRRQPTLGKIRHVHMVGIGGIGMSSIAEVLLSRGYRVSGSDLAPSEVTQNLERLGAQIFRGHSAVHVVDCDVVVYSSAVDRHDNPETQEADRRRIPLIKRSVMLGELMRMKFGVAIAGTHGKTTTTSLVGQVVAAGGFDPTIIVGGKVAAFGSNARVGEGDIIVIEADEYDRTFLRLTPSLAIITTIDEDHLDTYKDLAEIKDAFVEYADSVPFFGAAIVCLDDPNVQSIVGRLDRRVVTYGTSRQADVRVERWRQDGLHSVFTVVHGQEILGAITLRIPGLHNVLNALAAVAVGIELDMPFAEISKGLEGFTGVQRRFELLSDRNDRIVINDYAHHPAEVEATLAAATEAWPNNRIIAVFQPHLYSRTRDLADEFARAFMDADMLVLTDVYGAREEPLPGISGELIANKAKDMGHRDVHYIQQMRNLPVFVARHTRPGDRIIFMGAGDIWRAAQAYATSSG